jgi:hypothetical protein
MERQAFDWQSCKHQHAIGMHCKPNAKAPSQSPSNTNTSTNTNTSDNDDKQQSAQRETTKREASEMSDNQQ